MRTSLRWRSCRLRNCAGDGKTLKARQIAAGEQGPSPPRQCPQLTAGTRLVREWSGRTITLKVNDFGFQHAGRSWRSLIEIARNVTGARWSGPRFFRPTGNR